MQEIKTNPTVRHTTPLQLLAAFAATVAVLFVLLLGACALPAQPVLEHVYDSAQTIQQEGLYPEYFGFKLFQMDNYTDTIMLFEAAAMGEQDPLTAMMTATAYNVDNFETMAGDLAVYCERTIPLSTGAQKAVQLVPFSYARYWHGYLIWLRPLLCAMSITGVRVVQYLVLFALLVLAVLFACFCILASFGIGNMSQINSIAGNMNAAFGVPTLVTGLCLMVVTALIVIGGLKRVAAVTEKLVPLMALFYIAGALIIVVLHAGNIPAAFAAIFKGAFNLNAAGGGALGYGISQTITWGFKRGAFSNEAGLGSAVMVNSASNVKEPVHQGMWGVFEVFADTIVVCTLTALVILTTGVVDLQSGAVLAGVQDNALVGQAFTAAFGSFGPKFIAVSILLFAYSTTLGWSHYGTKAVEYLFGTTGSRIYKVVFVCMTVVGATMKLGLAWDLSDTFNGLMMIPNLIGVLALSGTVVDITKNYFARRVRGEDIEPMWSAFAEYQKEEEAEAAAEAAELEKAANE